MLSPCCARTSTPWLYVPVDMASYSFFMSMQNSIFSSPALTFISSSASRAVTTQVMSVRAVELEDGDALAVALHAEGRLTSTAYDAPTSSAWA